MGWVCLMELSIQMFKGYWELNVLSIEHSAYLFYITQFQIFIRLIFYVHSPTNIPLITGLMSVIRPSTNSARFPVSVATILSKDENIDE